MRIIRGRIARSELSSVGRATAAAIATSFVTVLASMIMASSLLLSRGI